MWISVLVSWTKYAAMNNLGTVEWMPLELHDRFWICHEELVLLDGGSLKPFFWSNWT